MPTGARISGYSGKSAKVKKKKEKAVNVNENSH